MPYIANHDHSFLFVWSSGTSEFVEKPYRLFCRALDVQHTAGCIVVVVGGGRNNGNVPPPVMAPQGLACKSGKECGAEELVIGRNKQAELCSRVEDMKAKMSSENGGGGRGGHIPMMFKATHGSLRKVSDRGEMWDVG